MSSPVNNIIVDLGDTFAEFVPASVIATMLAANVIYYCQPGNVDSCQPEDDEQAIYHVMTEYDEQTLGNVNAVQHLISSYTEVEGCGEEGPDGYRCTHHDATQHIARGTEPGSFAESWPLALDDWCASNNAPCKKCGRKDLPLHTDYLCTECHTVCHTCDDNKTLPNFQTETDDPCPDCQANA